MSAQPSTVTLPHTWRPFGVRLVGTVSGLALVIVVFAAWFGSTQKVRDQFSTLQIVTLILLGLLAFAVWFALVRCRVTATEKGLLIVNGYRYRDFEWAQIVNVSLNRGAPWASIDLSDGTTVAAMGIQGSDGQRAIRAAKQVKALVAARSVPEQQT